MSLDTKGLIIETSALKAFKGRGVVEVLDQTGGALLIERAIPGYSLKEFFPNRETEVIAIACEAIKKLHSVPIINQNGFSVSQFQFNLVNQGRTFR